MNYSRQLRVTALLTALIYIPVNHFGFAALPANALRTESIQIRPFQVSGLKLPANFGEVVESAKGKTDQAVIIIQDAHAVPDAQKNIANVIKFMQQEYGVSTVALEGASGDLDPQIFKSFPDQKLMREVIKGYLDAGEIAGGTAAAIFDKAPSAYKGVEDWDLYEQALGFYLKAMEASPVLLEKLNAERLTLDAEKQKIYSAELLKADAAIEKFYSNLSEVTDLFKVLGAVQPPKAGTDLEAVWKEVQKQLPNSGAIKEGKDIEVRAIANRVEKFLSARAAGLGTPAMELKVFNSKKQEWMTGAVSPEAFAMYLKETAAKFQIQIEMSTELLGMVHEQRKLKELEGTKFFKELEAYIRDVKEVLMRATTADSSGVAGASPEVKKVLDLDRQTTDLRTLKKLINLELTREEWNQFKTRDLRPETGDKKTQSAGSLDKKALGFGLSAMGISQSDMVYHLAFYASAEERDEVFFKNLKGVSGTQIMVAGGFHAEGLTSRLKEAGIGYVLVMPKITKIPENVTYRAQMRGEVSWKDYFEVENGRIHLYKAFVRAVRDKLLQGGQSSGLSSVPNGTQPNLQMLKAWRDQIIRDLSDMGKVERAAWYTRYMDEVLDPRGTKDAVRGTDLLMSKVDSFIRGLRGLEKNNQIDQVHIAQLLKANMLGQVTAVAPMAPSNSVSSNLLGRGSLGSSLKSVALKLLVAAGLFLGVSTQAQQQPENSPAPTAQSETKSPMGKFVFLTRLINDGKNYDIESEAIVDDHGGASGQKNTLLQLAIAVKPTLLEFLEKQETPAARDAEAVLNIIGTQIFNPDYAKKGIYVPTAESAEKMSDYFKQLLKFFGQPENLKALQKFNELTGAKAGQGNKRSEARNPKKGSISEIKLSDFKGLETTTITNRQIMRLIAAAPNGKGVTDKQTFQNIAIEILIDGRDEPITFTHGDPAKLNDYLTEAVTKLGSNGIKTFRLVTSINITLQRSESRERTDIQSDIDKNAVKLKWSNRLAVTFTLVSSLTLMGMLAAVMTATGVLLSALLWWGAVILLVSIPAALIFYAVMNQYDNRATNLRHEAYRVVTTSASIPEPGSPDSVPSDRFLAPDQRSGVKWWDLEGRFLNWLGRYYDRQLLKQFPKFTETRSSGIKGLLDPNEPYSQVSPAIPEPGRPDSVPSDRFSAPDQRDVKWWDLQGRFLNWAGRYYARALQREFSRSTPFAYRDGTGGLRMSPGQGTYYQQSAAIPEPGQPSSLRSNRFLKAFYVAAPFLFAGFLIWRFSWTVFGVTAVISIAVILLSGRFLDWTGRYYARALEKEFSRSTPFAYRDGTGGLRMSPGQGTYYQQSAAIPEPGQPGSLRSNRFLKAFYVAAPFLFAGFLVWRFSWKVFGVAAVISSGLILLVQLFRGASGRRNPGVEATHLADLRSDLKRANLDIELRGLLAQARTAWAEDKFSGKANLALSILEAIDRNLELSLAQLAQEISDANMAVETIPADSVEILDGKAIFERRLGDLKSALREIHEKAQGYVAATRSESRIGTLLKENIAVVIMAVVGFVGIVWAGIAAIKNSRQKEAAEAQVAMAARVNLDGSLIQRTAFGTVEAKIVKIGNADFNLTKRIFQHDGKTYLGIVVSSQVQTGVAYLQFPDEARKVFHETSRYPDPQISQAGEATTFNIPQWGVNGKFVITADGDLRVEGLTQTQIEQNKAAETAAQQLNEAHAAKEAAKNDRSEMRELSHGEETLRTTAVRAAAVFTVAALVLIIPSVASIPWLLVTAAVISISSLVVGLLSMVILGLSLLAHLTLPGTSRTAQSPQTGKRARSELRKPDFMAGAAGILSGLAIAAVIMYQIVKSPGTIVFSTPILTVSFLVLTGLASIPFVMGLRPVFEWVFAEDWKNEFGLVAKLYRQFPQLDFFIPKPGSARAIVNDLSWPQHVSIWAFWRSDFKQRQADAATLNKWLAAARDTVRKRTIADSHQPNEEAIAQYKLLLVIGGDEGIARLNAAIAAATSLGETRLENLMRQVQPKTARSEIRLAKGESFSVDQYENVRYHTLIDVPRESKIEFQVWHAEQDGLKVKFILPASESAQEADFEKVFSELLKTKKRFELIGGTLQDSDYEFPVMLAPLTSHNKAHNFTVMTRGLYRPLNLLPVSFWADLKTGDAFTHTLRHEFAHALSFMAFSVGVNEKTHPIAFKDNPHFMALEEGLVEYLASDVDWNQFTVANETRSFFNGKVLGTPAVLEAVRAQSKMGLTQLDFEKAIGWQVAARAGASNYWGETHHSYGRPFWRVFSQVFGENKIIPFLNELNHLLKERNLFKINPLQTNGSGLIRDALLALLIQDNAINGFELVLAAQLKSDLLGMRSEFREAIAAQLGAILGLMNAPLNSPRGKGDLLKPEANRLITKAIAGLHELDNPLSKSMNTLFAAIQNMESATDGMATYRQRLDGSLTGVNQKLAHYEYELKIKDQAGIYTLELSPFGRSEVRASEISERVVRELWDKVASILSDFGGIDPAIFTANGMKEETVNGKNPIQAGDVLFGHPMRGEKVDQEVGLIIIVQRVEQNGSVSFRQREVILDDSNRGFHLRDVVTNTSVLSADGKLSGVFVSTVYRPSRSEARYSPEVDEEVGAFDVWLGDKRKMRDDADAIERRATLVALIREYEVGHENQAGKAFSLSDEAVFQIVEKYQGQLTGSDEVISDVPDALGAAQAAVLEEVQKARSFEFAKQELSINSEHWKAYENATIDSVNLPDVIGNASAEFSISGRELGKRKIEKITFNWKSGQPTFVYFGKQHTGELPARKYLEATSITVKYARSEAREKLIEQAQKEFKGASKNGSFSVFGIHPEISESEADGIGIAQTWEEVNGFIARGLIGYGKYDDAHPNVFFFLPELVSNAPATTAAIPQVVATAPVARAPVKAATVPGLKLDPEAQINGFFNSLRNNPRTVSGTTGPIKISRSVMMEGYKYGLILLSGDDLRDPQVSFKNVEAEQMLRAIAAGARWFQIAKASGELEIVEFETDAMEAVAQGATFKKSDIDADIAAEVADATKAFEVHHHTWFQITKANGEQEIVKTTDLKELLTFIFAGAKLGVSGIEGANFYDVVAVQVRGNNLLRQYPDQNNVVVHESPISNSRGDGMTAEQVREDLGVNITVINGRFIKTNPALEVFRAQTGSEISIIGAAAPISRDEVAAAIFRGEIALNKDGKLAQFPARSEVRVAARNLSIAKDGKSAKLKITQEGQRELMNLIKATIGKIGTALAKRELQSAPALELWLIRTGEEKENTWRVTNAQINNKTNIPGQGLGDQGPSLIIEQKSDASGPYYEVTLARSESRTTKAPKRSEIRDEKVIANDVANIFIEAQTENADKMVLAEKAQTLAGEIAGLGANHRLAMFANALYAAAADLIAGKSLPVSGLETKEDVLNAGKFSMEQKRLAEESGINATEYVAYTIKSTDTLSAIQDLVSGLAADDLASLQGVYVSVEGQDRERVNAVRDLFTQITGEGKLSNGKLVVSSKHITEIVPSSVTAKSTVVVLSLNEIDRNFLSGENLLPIGTIDGSKMDPLVRAVYVKTLTRFGRLIALKMKAGVSLEVIAKEVAGQLNISGAIRYDGQLNMFSSVIVTLIQQMRSEARAAVAA